MSEEIGVFKGKKYRAVNFVPSTPEDTACNNCAFELGKCRGAIFTLGQCYVKEGEKIVVNIFYEEVKE